MGKMALNDSRGNGEELINKKISSKAIYPMLGLAMKKLAECVLILHTTYWNCVQKHAQSRAVIIYLLTSVATLDQKHSALRI